MLVAGLLAAAPCWSHAVLKASTPASGAEIAPSQVDLKLVFNEPLEDRFCSVSIVAANGQVVASPVLKAEEKDPSTLTATVPTGSLSAGRYSLRWSAMGRDGHRTKGEFGFTVK